MIWADLHCHTAYSDGSATPLELISLAKKIGLKGISITDHDTIEAYPSAIEAAHAQGVYLGTGVEFSCEFQGTSIHILGYDFDLLTPEIHQLCERHRKRREKRNQAILEKLVEHRCPITYDELLSKTTGKSIGRPHIAELMVEKQYVKTVRAAFHGYIGEGKKCYVQGEAFKVQEAIDVIHCAKGKAFIAHPQLLPHHFPIEELLKLPFDGIECYYARIFNQKWPGVAQAKGWLLSGGSDFHGNVKPAIELGCNGVDQETFYRIFENPVA